MDADSPLRPPGEPPWSPDELVTALARLQEAQPDERIVWLRRLRSEPGARAFAELLEGLIDPEPTPAVAIADRWTEAGHREDQAIGLLARLCEEVDLASDWTDWEDVADRSEVRLRLQALARADTIDARLQPFLTFFFRASDPDLYRWAALAIGRHLDQLPDAETYVRSWVEDQGLVLAEPARLEGERAPRRLLFLQIGVATRPGGSPAALGDPRRSLERLLEETPGPIPIADLGVGLRAVQMLTEAGEDTDELATTLLERARQIPAALDRHVLEAWANLFAVARERSEGSHARRLDETLEALAVQSLGELRSADVLGELVAALQTLDHLVRAFVPLEAALGRARAEDLLAQARGIERRWLRARIQTWTSRAHRSPDEHLPEEEPASLGDEDLPWPVAMLVSPAWPDPEAEVFLEPRVEAALDRLDESLDLFASEEEWKTRNRRVRALGLFEVLDLLRHEALPGERLSALVDRHGVLLGDPDLAEGEGARRRAALARVLARVVDWEEASGDPLLDARTIHEVDDNLLLLGFVPTGRQPPWLASLADAIENRFRWRLRRDGNFHPVGFLARLTIREPHPDLYDTLATVSEGRRYPVPGREEGFPLPEVARELGDQARAARRGAPLDEILDAWDPAQLASWDPLARDLARVREALEELGEPEAPGDGARRLCDLVGRTDPRGSASGATILGLLASLHAPRRPVPRPGDPPWTRDTLETCLREASDEAADVTTLADRLEAGVPLNEMRTLLEQLRTSLTGAVDALVDGLPLAETRLLFDRSRALDETQARWIEALTAIEDLHDEALDGGEEDWTRLVSTATQRWSGGALGPVLLRLWRSLVDPPRPARSTPEPHETWDRRARLVRWGASTEARSDWTAPDRRAWDEEVARAYEALLQEVMAANREDWALDLLEDEAYRRPRTAEIVQDTLQEARDWCRDRYRLRASLSARRTLAEQRGEDPPDLVREAGAFVAHFSPVWSALLVGAIFLLDFGDAWVELAEAGDLRGIVLTCLIGVVGAYLYVVRDLKSKVAARPDETTRELQRRLLGRSAAFTGLCILVAVVITTFLWWMLGATGAVVRGPWALANIAVWTGFALFVGIVFGLVIQKGI